jgi:diguanylate cyclase (GGDEF)-like protein
VTQDIVGYAYITISTSAVFAALGLLLGSKEDRTRSLMMTDPLTGLFNRRYYDLRLRDELAKVARYGGNLALLLIDVDRLKEINDRLGHEGGDRALVAVASALRTSLRATDIAARYGGDEFAALCPFTSAHEASVLAHRMQTRLEALLSDTLVTVSIGVADLREARAENAEALFDAADRALYEAKAAGRNWVQVAEALPTCAHLLAAQAERSP